MQQFPKQKWLLVLVFVLLITNIITLSIYWLKEKPPHKPEGVNREKRMGQFMVTELKLSPEQETVYWKMRDTLVNEQRLVMDSVRIVKKQFYDLLKQPNTYSDPLLKAKSAAVAVQLNKLDLLTFRHFEKLKAICTPEQLQQYDRVVEEIVNRMSSWRRTEKGDSTKPKEQRR
ncbi:MAG: hypothetical protein P0Y53_24640 [Candidatus Pseudobacter hemicellulosilyticus]|uniref:Periplasmic heavy metal sensor n=1 Tax=Candidatus Pseudobacter hemicellulosilyticus TaxID=3121375 RepID=A0AAJ5WU31_9BACT|nr:MAG: hypothetical protein P0Y53_24640 [Pseudobacter sp.]